MTSNSSSLSPAVRKIDPTRPHANSGPFDSSPDAYDSVEVGPTPLALREWAEDGMTLPDITALREYRLGRLVQELNRRGWPGILLFDPINIRYATDSVNMQIWVMHNPSRACFVSCDGYVVLWDCVNCEHHSRHLPLVREVRTGAAFFYFVSGDRVNEHAQRFANEVSELLQVHAGGDRRIAVDRIEPAGARALCDLGIAILSGQEVAEHARSIKNRNEVNAMRCAVSSCERAIGEMRAIFQPGVTELELWTELQRANSLRGGEWIETRILNSGPRTNPWYQECGPRSIREGDLLAFDTDLIGPYGYCADISRTWHAGEAEPSAYEKELYRHAHEHVEANIALLKPGLAFSEVIRSSHKLAPRFRKQRYGVMIHGVGLCDEYPAIPYPDDAATNGYKGLVESGMTLCVEAYVGEFGGPGGVKLEDQILVTEAGIERISRYPFEERFFA